MAISALFDISIDELFGKVEKKQEDYLLESITEYDIDGPKHYDMHVRCNSLKEKL